MEKIFSFDPNSPLLFTQFYFWAFLAVVFMVLTLIGNKRLLRNAFLFLVSVFFYFKTSGLSLLILLFVTVSDFLIAKRISRSKKEGARKAWLILSVAIDLSILCYFKYAYFFADFIQSITGLEIKVVNIFSQIGNIIAGKELFSVDSIVLPVGISFFTFQVISYTVDVYRKEIEPVRNLLDFGFYVSFFPQLVAGPIVKASDFIPQLYKNFHLGRRQFGIAIFWILNGLAKKIILSDYIAVNFVDRVFENPLLFTGFENFAALFGYSLQVYADFSGYTDIAIGVAMLMGFYLPQNFDSPYKAANPQDFWRRWHMSLSRWLKGYLYIPLGGNREASFGTYFWIVLFAIIAAILSSSWAVSLIFVGIALLMIVISHFSKERKKSIIANLNRFITMLLGGLWHGASWNFIIWGGLNGVGMIAFQLWKKTGWHLKMLFITVITATLCAVRHFYPLPIWNLLTVWMLVIFAGTAVRYVYHLCKGQKGQKLGYVWGVIQTFVFITFTRLFFRSGSNLDPETANMEAWSTAKNMVNQIGSKWNTEVIPDIIANYWEVFTLIILGMIIHWLPSRWKRWYRINFALLPIPVMLLVVVAAVFVIYQFITADMQAFIYFQF
ncbi:MAG: MBOAT family protein [Bacteroidales bacterium]|nr:MBOAT family protein [Bacteroidales bacterium]